MRQFYFFKSKKNTEQKTANEKQTTNAQELGRSMVEILGVLAIIGVLAIGGITTYRYAMNKYRANDIINEVNLRATDIWNKYQEIPLPDNTDDETDFPEYPTITPAGFPIEVESHPDVAFKIYVDNVSPGVCKQVLNMPLIDVVKGIKFVQVNDAKFNGNDTSICENQNENTLIFTSFMNSEDSGELGDYCLDDADCSSNCGMASCDNNTLTCTDMCTRIGKICADKGYEWGCVDCATNDDCREGEVCSTDTYTCVTIPEKCAPNEFRALTGACISCDYPGEIKVDPSDTPYSITVGGITIQDDKTGQEMCNQCSSIRRYETGIIDGVETAYCSFACSRGISFMSANNGCVRCDATSSSNLDANSSVELPNDPQALAQCEACPNRMVFTYYNQKRCVVKECQENYFRNDTGSCRTCKHYGSGSAWPQAVDMYGAITVSANSGFADAQDPCASCTDLERYLLVNGSARYCFRKCTADNMFQDTAGTCYPCDTESSISVSGWSHLQELCLACEDENGNPNRVVKNGYCMLESLANGECPKGQFKGKDEQCYSCTETTRKVIVSEEESKCSANCEGYGTESQEGRYIVSGYCYPKCKNGYFQLLDGTCVACDKIVNSKYIGKITGLPDVTAYAPAEVRQVCNENCASFDYANGPNNWACTPKSCPSGYFRTIYDVCLLCNATESTYIYSPELVTKASKSDCEGGCGPSSANPRIHIPYNNLCARYNPGVTGVCNSNSISSAYPGYPSGDGKTFLDFSSGTCKPCSSTTSYITSEEECATCGNRRYSSSDKRCIYGLCEEGSTFLEKENGSNKCASCNDMRKVVQTQNTNDAGVLCTACNRRILTVGSSDKGDLVAYCAVQCNTDEWQDVNGNCYGNSDVVSAKEIGTDATSISLCNAAQRRVTEDENGRLYCEE